MNWSHLPREGTWEIGLVQLPGLEVQDTPLLGTLLVLDRKRQQIRAAVPLARGSSLDAELARAVLEPAAGCSPARPRRIRCLRGLRPLLKDFAVAARARVDVVDRLPSIDALAEDLAVYVAAGPPLTVRDVAAWSEILEGLVGAAFWEAIPDSVVFRFPLGGELLGQALAIVLGHAESQRGLVIYPSAEDYRNFLRDMQGHETTEGWSCWSVHLDPVHELPPSHAAALEQAGLVAQGLALQVFVTSGAEMEPPEPPVERACQAVCQALLQAWREHGASLGLQDTVTRSETVLGELVVAGCPPPPPPGERLLAECEHRVLFEQWPDQPRMIVKATKRNALKLARLLEGADAVSIDDTQSGEVVLYAWDRSRCLGAVARVGPLEELWGPWEAAGGGLLIISGGGPRRRGLHERDFVATLPVEWLGRHADDFPASEESGLLEGLHWEGSPEQWPKASSVLLALVEPFAPQTMPLPLAQDLLELAVALWDAVVAADVQGRPEFLRDLLALGGQKDLVRPEMLDFLVDRKRRFFAQDTRVFRLDEADHVDGELKVLVSWAVA